MERTNKTKETRYSIRGAPFMGNGSKKLQDSRFGN